MPRSSTRQQRLAERTALVVGPYEEAILDRVRERGLLDLLHDVAADHFVPPFEIVGRSRRPTPTKARHEVWRRLRVKHEFSYNEIAALFDRDHTTVMNGIRNARRRIGDTT